jgi:prepilin-type N-terminal cleavage/methylation domain-containing protein
VRRRHATSARSTRVELPDEGFTLVELVVVLAILSVSAFLVLPAVGRGAEALRLRTEGGRVAALLRDARREAVTRRLPARVALDGGTGVTLTLGDGDAASRRIELAEGFHLSAPGGAQTVTFSSRGLGREMRWILEGRAGRRLAISVDAVTGRVTVRPESGS